MSTLYPSSEPSSNDLLETLPTGTDSELKLADSEATDRLQEDIHSLLDFDSYDVHREKITAALDVVDAYFATAGAVLTVKAYDNGYAAFVETSNQLSPRIVHARIDSDLLRTTVRTVIADSDIATSDSTTHNQLTTAVIDGYNAVFDIHIDSIPGNKQTHWSAFTDKNTDNTTGITFYTPHFHGKIDDVQSTERPLALIAGIQQLTRDLNAVNEKPHFQTDVGFTYLTAHLMDAGYEKSEAISKVAHVYGTRSIIVKNAVRDLEFSLPSDTPQLDYYLTPGSHEMFQQLTSS